ncbi:LysR family transcriptional regulator [Neorhizobium galegae]|uniref:LysR family transcriptional regulator n=1 Tax=Neorhizobium galegae TaxID=399 RepID=UPI0006215FB1|nr:LysR family transcriptional regulator [Neorhizobium galegae]MCQ1849596.1 LysR family transcriptional regulator [Neorhizobium galegae]CDZ29065.1 Transcriptional regulator, LysR family [Neorhizobium galegae bv. officinalis]CDZ43342.1 Transcriptional regulator, LysR family [Neorhizobium galegae bv. officinalis]
MEIEDLRIFVEVADAGGVSAAALRLGISKSMVSRRITQLEAELGAQLLARTTRGIALTEAGATFREYAARISAELDVARETILPAGELRGRMRVAAPLSFGPTHFAPVLSQMAGRHPQLQIQSSYTDRFVDLVGEGFDCAIRLGHLPDSNLVAKRVGPIFAKLVASPAYIEAHGAPETPEEIAKHHVVMREAETWQFTDGDKIIKVRPRGRFVADNAISLVAAALEGIGISYLPEPLVADHISSGALVPIMARHPIPPAGIFVVRPPGQYPSRKVRVLTDMLMECFGAPPVGVGAQNVGKEDDPTAQG